MNQNRRAWAFTTPSWWDRYEECDGVWFDPVAAEWKAIGSRPVDFAERNQAHHAERFAQWASHRLAETAPQRGWEACRRAVMRLVAAWCDYGSALEDRIRKAWFLGEYVTDSELAEEARAFGYMEIAEILEPIIGHEHEKDGGMESMHKRVHW